MKTRRRRFYGWRVVLVGALIVAIASNPVGAVGLPRMAEIALGDLWTVRGHVALFAFAHLVLTGALPALLLPFVGWGVDRWGSRRMVLYGLITLGAGLRPVSGSAGYGGLLPGHRHGQHWWSSGVAVANRDGGEQLV